MAVKTFNELKYSDLLFLLDPSSGKPKSMRVKDLVKVEGEPDLIIVQLFRIKGEAGKIYKSDDDIPTLNIIVQKRLSSMMVSWKVKDNILAVPVPFFTTLQELKQWMKKH